MTSAIQQAGANQVSVIASSAERAAVEFAKAAAIRPSEIEKRISRNEPGGIGALRLRSSDGRLMT